MPNVKLSPFSLKSQSPQDKFVIDNKIPFEMICDEYIEIFNELINVGKIFHPVGVSPKSFNNSYMFKKGGTLSIMSFLKFNGCNKLSRVVCLDYKCNNLRTIPLQGGEIHIEQVPSLGLPSLVRVLI